MTQDVRRERVDHAKCKRPEFSPAMLYKYSSDMNHASGIFHMAISIISGSTKSRSWPISAGCPRAADSINRGSISGYDGQKAKSSTSRCAVDLEMTGAEGLAGFAGLQDGAA
ncbi:hypothetical protein TrVFT333_011330 [Trichoderma virens FT-333]|nr:hypothetical protein TrVFT333_011330 [Trichoderma virens FT-333]